MEIIITEFMMGAILGIIISGIGTMIIHYFAVKKIIDKTNKILRGRDY